MPPFQDAGQMIHDCLPRSSTSVKTRCNQSSQKHEKVGDTGLGIAVVEVELSIPLMWSRIPVGALSERQSNLDWADWAMPDSFVLVEDQIEQATLVVSVTLLSVSSKSDEI